ncbi:MAG: hypothetical protein ACI9VL_000381 [Colwellia sp.]|jgi:hypothetical protein
MAEMTTESLSKLPKSDLVTMVLTLTESLSNLSGESSKYIAANKREIERFRFLVTSARHDLFKKNLITLDEVMSWQV